MTDKEQKAAAKEFAEDWKGKGDEKQETSSFWIELLGKVLGIEEPTKYIVFEKPVVVEKNQKYIDGYISTTKVLIEQKSSHVELSKNAVQSDGEKLTPYGQAFRYNNYLPYDQKAKWIIVSNFKEILIYDQNKPNGEPEKILLADLPKEYYRLNFLVDSKNEHLQKEMEVSLQAGEIVGRLYNALLKQYRDPENPESLRSLNMLCVRLVFCLYAEDAGIFGKHDMFHDYLSKFAVKDVRKALIELFKMLDTKVCDRDPYDDTPVAEFPYVNGGLFADESIEIPQFNEEIVELLLKNASLDFDWSMISPTIFGAVFESTLNPETRRSGGMHYTSIENIHKVIDPLFLDDLKAELEEIKQYKQPKTIAEKVEKFKDKLANLKFLDPACGSGNFLTETYISLRRLENEAIKLTLDNGQMMFDMEGVIRVSIGQFYGIEINDFAVTVAKTALWIAESQMMQETEEIISKNLDFLPLKSYANIVEGNALRVDWESVVPKSELDYIMGNPPFVGYSLQSKEQKDDILSIYVDEKGKPYKTAGKIDYVAGWYFKAAQLMTDTNIRTAFVSTNSITQGEQVAGVWKPLYDRFGIHIDFAHRTFRWDSEASLKAHVHCVIVGFSIAENAAEKRLFDNGVEKKCRNINAYLINSDDILVEGRNKPLCNVPAMIKGFQPTDNGLLIFSDEEKNDFIVKEPNSEKWFRPYISSKKHIEGINQWCLWLVNISPKEINEMPLVRKRVKQLKEWREIQPHTGDAYKLKDTVGLMRGANSLNITNKFITLPQTSSGNRKYIPIEIIENVIPNNSMRVVLNANLYQFGVLISNVHMAWMRVTTGRMKSDYQYTIDTVYNCFPWCTPTPEQKAKIEQTAQAILDARAKCPDSSLADLYDEISMPKELRKAHQANDRAVMQAYGFDVKTMTESSCVAELMKMYKELTE